MIRFSSKALAVMLAAPALAITSAACASPNSSAYNAAAVNSPITEAEVAAAQKAWGEGIVSIGATYTADGDYTAAATDHINKFYAYSAAPVLFKPTLAAEDQFRGTFDEALSYFVGGSIEEDKGFAIAPFTDVRWENEATFIDSDSAMAMGNYYFTRPTGEIVKVEYSFGYMRAEDGSLKIVLHHSSLPFDPN